MSVDKSAARFALKPRLEKLGVKRGSHVVVVNLAYPPFIREVNASGALVREGRPAKGSDIIFFGVARARELDRLERLKTFLQPAGALWVIRPKGRPEISERAVFEAGKAAGLVDVKVVSFSTTHSALKFVIPVHLRPRPAR